MNVVDSSGWLEYFANGVNAGFFAPPITDAKNLLVPTLSVLEVFKRVLQQRGEGDALQAVALMHQGRIAELTAEIAIEAAKLGHLHKLPLADSVIVATAHRHQATLWTQDADLKGLPGVRFIQKKTP